jgi:hypothetical protein
MMQPPPPPQFSPDGLYWWDGVRWVPRPGVPPVAPSPPAYPPPPPPFSGYSGTPSYLKPSPGLRIVLLVALGLDVGLTGLLMLIFLIAAVQPERTGVEPILAFAFTALFVMAVAALIGVAIRASWSRWLALASGILISWTVAGLLVGVPIVVCAARAPDLGPRRG